MTAEEKISYKGIDMADLIGQLRAGPALLRQSVEGLTDAQVEATPVPRKWSTRTVVEHITLVGLGWTNICFEAIGKVHDNPRNHNP